MGSTVTTGRMAAAFRAKSGTVIYCLYEQTYEKNCYPHTPHWSAIYIGEAHGALCKIFNYASACEGGMLQNRSGAEAVVLEVGTRTPGGDSGEYPDIDMVFRAGGFFRRDGSPYPKQDRRS